MLPPFVQLGYVAPLPGRDLPTGHSIPGSKFLRDYCFRCGTPMRVQEADGLNWCEECSPCRSAGCGSPFWVEDDDMWGYRTIAVRCLEDELFS